MSQYFLYCNQNTVSMTKYACIDFMELFFVVVIFVMYICVPEVEKFLLWTSLKCQDLPSRYRCGAGFGDAISLQVSMSLFANGKSNVLPKG